MSDMNSSSRNSDQHPVSALLGADCKSINRSATNPGGMHCMSCGVIFVGEPFHDLCGVCASKVQSPEGAASGAYTERMTEEFSEAQFGHSLTWIRAGDCLPVKDGMLGEQWLLTWCTRTGTYDVGCIDGDWTHGETVQVADGELWAWLPLNPENLLSDGATASKLRDTAWMLIEHFERVDASQRDKDVIAKAISALTDGAQRQDGPPSSPGMNPDLPLLQPQEEAKTTSVEGWGGREHVNALGAFLVSRCGVDDRTAGDVALELIEWCALQAKAATLEERIRHPVTPADFGVGVDGVDQDAARQNFEAWQAQAKEAK